MLLAYSGLETMDAAKHTYNVQDSSLLEGLSSPKC